MTQALCNVIALGTVHHRSEKTDEFCNFISNHLIDSRVLGQVVGDGRFKVSELVNNFEFIYSSQWRWLGGVSVICPNLFC